MAFAPFHSVSARQATCQLPFDSNSCQNGSCLSRVQKNLLIYIFVAEFWCSGVAGDSQGPWSASVHSEVLAWSVISKFLSRRLEQVTEQEGDKTEYNACALPSKQTSYRCAMCTNLASPPALNMCATSASGPASRRWGNWNGSENEHSEQMSNVTRGLHKNFAMPQDSFYLLTLARLWKAFSGFQCPSLKLVLLGIEKTFPEFYCTVQVPPPLHQNWFCLVSAQWTLADGGIPKIVFISPLRCVSAHAASTCISLVT